MPTSFVYRAYGLRLRADRPLSGLAAAEHRGRADLHIDLTGGVPDELRRARESEWAAISEQGAEDIDAVQTDALSANNNTYLRLRYAIDERRADFVIDAAGTRVWAIFTDDVGFDDVASFLLGPVLGRVLRLRGVPCLHASAVAIGRYALAIVGPKGAGKSTMAAGLAAMGCPVLADDVAALSEAGGAYVVQPGPCRLRLWNPAISAFYGSRDQLPRVLSIRSKRFVDLAPDEAGAKWRFQPEPLPLRAAYVLGGRGPTTTAPALRPLSPAQALIALTANSYAGHSLDPAAREREFLFLGNLVQQVPVRRIERPDATDAVPRLCELVRDDFERLCTASARM